MIVKKILFLCTGNSCRSQMAEALLRSHKPNEYEVFSAGTKPGILDPRAVKVMKEMGIDISNQYAKSLSKFSNTSFYLVVTVCDNARETCPLFLGQAKKIHKGFQDPPFMANEIAQNGGSEEKQLDCYRFVRDQIHQFIKEYF